MTLVRSEADESETMNFKKSTVLQPRISELPMVAGV